MAALRAEAQTQPTATEAHKWWALIATCFGLFMALLDVTVVTVALPTIQRSLAASFADLQWVVSAYTLALAVFLVTAGRLGDLFGRKRVFMLGVAVFSLGSLLCALSGNISAGAFTPIRALIAARALQGLGGSIMLPLSLAIISATFHGRERGAAIGIWGGVSGLAVAIGPLVGGVLVQHVSWQSIFLVNVPIGAVGLGVAAWAIRESRDERAPRSIDWYGLITVTVGMFCLLLGLIQGANKGWTSAYILTLFAVAAAATAAFVVGEFGRPHAMMDPRLFTNRSFLGAAVCAFALNGGLYSLFFFLTIYLQNYLGLDAMATGVRLLPLSAVTMIGAPLAGRMTDRIGARPVLTVGLGLATAGVLLMLRASDVPQAAQWIALLPAFIVAGLGSGMVNPPISTVAVGTVSRARAGMASGVSAMCRQIGNAFGIAFLGAMLTSRYNVALRANILGLQAPGLTAPVKQSIAGGVQQAGAIAGSTGLQGGTAFSNPFAAQPLFPQVQHAARMAFMSGFRELLWIAAGLTAIGVLAALLIRQSDMHHHREEAMVPPTH
jgi:EmrB/QacA subfamily drug resistance transporter